jgi:hypothetical protein
MGKGFLTEYTVSRRQIAWLSESRQFSEKEKPMPLDATQLLGMFLFDVVRLSEP